MAMVVVVAALGAGTSSCVVKVGVGVVVECGMVGSSWEEGPARKEVISYSYMSGR
jgi:hypothetical protein